MTFQLDFSRYEPLEGQRPYRLLDRHPTGAYLALAAPGEQTSAAVWESQTGKLVWVPKGAILLSWLEHGAQVVQVKEPRDLERPPEQEDQLYLFERQHWPDGPLISRCLVTLSQGEPESLVVSPHGNLVVLRWIDQGASGWEFIHLRETGDVHLKEAGLEIDSEVAVSTQPAFSPDGRYAVSGYHAQFNTAAPAWESAHWKIAQRGRYEVGCVTVIRLFDGTCYQIPIADTVPVKLHGTSSRSLDPPSFLDSQHFLVRFPTGAKRRYQVQGAAPQSGDSRQR